MQTRWNSQAHLSAPQPHSSSPPHPPGPPQSRGTTSSKQGLAQGCGQHAVNRGGSRRGCSGAPWGLWHRCSPLASARQAAERAAPTHVPKPVPTTPSLDASGLPAHWQEQRASPHHSRKWHHGTHSASVFDCNTAGTDFPLPLTWAFLLSLSSPFQPHRLTSAPLRDREAGQEHKELCPRPAWHLRRGGRAPQAPESLRSRRACRGQASSTHGSGSSRWQGENRAPRSARTAPCGHIRTDVCVPQQPSTPSLQGKCP